MGKILMLSDVHLDPRDRMGQFVSLPYGLVSQRLLDKINILQKIVEIVREEEINLIIDLGDVCNLINPPEWLRNKYAQSFLAPLLNLGCEIIMIAGNHGSDKRSTAFQSFEKISENVIFVNEPLIIEKFGKRLSFLPFYSLQEEKKLKKDLIGIPGDFLFTHLPVNKAQNYNGFKLPGFPPEIFKDYEAVYTGHYHRKQKIGNITYIGSLTVNNWNDWKIKNPGRVSILSISSSSKTNLKNISSLEDRKFFSYIVRIKDGMAEFWENNQDLDSLFDSIIRIQLIGSPSEIGEFDFKYHNTIFKKHNAHNVIWDIIKESPETIKTTTQEKNWEKIIEEKAKKDKELTQLGISFVKDI